MTRKDYILIAERLKPAYAAVLNDYSYDDRTYEEGFIEAVAAIAQALADDNPKFDYERFVEYITRV